MIGLSPGQVLRFREDDHRERLLWLDPDGRYGWFIDIDGTAAQPVCRERQEFEELFAEGLLDSCEDPWLIAGEALSKIQQSRRDEAWEAIRPVTLFQPAIFDPGARAERTAIRATETGVSQRTLYRLLRRWW